MTLAFLSLVTQTRGSGSGQAPSGNDLEPAYGHHKSRPKVRKASNLYRKQDDQTARAWDKKLMVEESEAMQKQLEKLKRAEQCSKPIEETFRAIAEMEFSDSESTDYTAPGFETPGSPQSKSWTQYPVEGAASPARFPPHDRRDTFSQQLVTKEGETSYPASPVPGQKRRPKPQRSSIKRAESEPANLARSKPKTSGTVSAANIAKGVATTVVAGLAAKGLYELGCFVAKALTGGKESKNRRLSRKQESGEPLTSRILREKRRASTPRAV